MLFLKREYNDMRQEINLKQMKNISLRRLALGAGR